MITNQLRRGTLLPGADHHLALMFSDNGGKTWSHEVKPDLNRSASDWAAYAAVDRDQERPPISCFQLPWAAGVTRFVSWGTQIVLEKLAQDGLGS